MLVDTRCDWFSSSAFPAPWSVNFQLFMMLTIQKKKILNTISPRWHYVLRSLLAFCVDVCDL